jgi:hypothetical protein
MNKLKSVPGFLSIQIYPFRKDVRLNNQSDRLCIPRVTAIPHTQKFPSSEYFMRSTFTIYWKYSLFYTSHSAEQSIPHHGDNFSEALMMLS